ncbi:unnamed protein product [Pedinophyceae sp. YPF-701]|nr:unnamed protein product [Pedinophyceae sp. YPF-701]
MPHFPGPPSLHSLCIDKVANRIGDCESLEGLPEDIVCAIFVRVLELGRLTPRALRLFERTQHPLIVQAIRSLNIQTLPAPDYSWDGRWLGQRPPP